MNNFLLLTDYSFVSASKTSLSSPVSSVGHVKTSAIFSESSAVSQRPRPPHCLSVGSSLSRKSLIGERRTVLEDAVVGGGSEGEASVNVENVTWLERQLLLIVFTFTKID